MVPGLCSGASMFRKANVQEGHKSGEGNHLELFFFFKFRTSEGGQFSLNCFKFLFSLLRLYFCNFAIFLIHPGCVKKCFFETCMKRMLKDICIRKMGIECTIKSIRKIRFEHIFKLIGTRP